jgi:hypothetical protein
VTSESDFDLEASLDNQPEIARDRVTLQVNDGSAMAAYVARPQNEGENRHPGIIVLQEAFGVNSHIRSVADRLAGQGYVAIAPELFHRTAPGFEGDYKDFASVKPHVQAVTTETAEADVRAAFDWCCLCVPRFRFMGRASRPIFWIAPQLCTGLCFSFGAGWTNISKRSTGKR